ncbi:MAG TPA: SNF2-related protein [Bacteroidia bacterium]|nr:SNF2-related protein [Bacteroidia bacterium]
MFTPYHAKYIAHELTKRSSSDSMQKLASTFVDAQVDLNPHQVEAALFAFQSPLSKGAILADEVGLGKTIEAGLVISQKWAERKRRILIITPSNLRKQWSQELADKFFLPSIVLETKSFNESIKKQNLNPFIQNEIIICSYQFARSKESYVESVDWDLAVIDEAHRLRNVYKTSNRIGKSIKNSLAKAPKVLLTATPLQNSLQELYGLVSIIDDYAFGDIKSFRAQYSRVNSTADESVFAELKERLKPICKRTLRRQVLEYIKYTNRIALVEEFYPTDEEQRLYDLVSNYLQSPNLFALPPSQRQLMTLILRKLLASSTYAISGTLEALAGKLEGIITNHNQNGVEETITNDYETYDELKDEWVDDENGEEKEEKTYTTDDIENIKSEISQLKEFEALAKSIQVNSKGEKLFTALQAGFKKATEQGASKKAIIFTESTRTQSYLREILEARGYKDKVVLFNGSNTDPKSKEIYKAWIERYQNTDHITGSKTADMRAALVEYFRDEATIMIATEAAAEGINLQFCSLIVNYDLPWNPQRIEQRIGRCHRYGQKYDVVVVNFLNKANAADLRVYDLLNEKFSLFNGVFGASDEVLGSIENGVDFEKRIAKIYQECRTPEQIQILFDELQKDLESQINTELNQTRQKLLENFDEEVHEKLKINLKESKEYLSKYENWLWDITQYYLNDNADFSSSEHSFTLRNNPFPNEKIHSGPYRIGKNIEDANIYRISHPLAERIIHECKTVVLTSAQLEFDYSGTVKSIFVLENLVGKSGWLKVSSLTVESFETEDYIIASGITDTGEVLDAEQCQRLFSLAATQNSIADKTDLLKVEKQLNDNQSRIKNEILEQISVRNGSYFELELEKLDKWGDDRRSSLKITLKELDDQIKDIKKQIRLAPNLPEKLKLEKEKRKLETQRDEAWKEYDGAAKEIDRSKDKLIDEIEKKLSQSLQQQELFTIQWKIK